MRAILFLLAVVVASPATAQSLLGGGYGTGSNTRSHDVAPHVTSRGTYVEGHRQTNPNSTQSDNYSARGNVNPYTGALGTRSPRW